MNGEQASNSELVWRKEEPNNQAADLKNKDRASVIGNFASLGSWPSDSGLSNDIKRTNTIQGLCEKH